MAQGRDAHWMGRVCVTAFALAASACAATEQNRQTAPEPRRAQALFNADAQSARPTAANPAAIAPSPHREPDVYYDFGNDRLIDQGVAAEPLSGERSFSLNMVDAPLAELVDRVIRDMLGAAYVLDGELDGLVTVQSNELISAAEGVSLLEAALASHGASLYREGRVYRIAANRGGAEAARNGRGEFAQAGDTFAFPLRHAPAEELVTLLEPVLGDGATVSADPRSNALVLSGDAEAIAAARDIIAMFDVDWFEGVSFALVPARWSNASTLAGELDAAFIADGGGLAGTVRLVPINRLNAVLVIANQASQARRVAQWAERLARAQQELGRQPFVYEVQNRPAQELAALLNAIYGFGDSANGETAQTLAAVAPSLDPAVVGGAPSAAAPATGAGRVSVDLAANALVMIATPSEFEQTLTLVRQLDALPNQVLLEATIAEVTLTDDLRYGLQWFFTDGDATTTFSDAANGAVASSFPGLSVLFEGSDGRAALNAVAELTNVEILSSPTLMVLDNRSATLSIGDQVPVITQSAVSVIDPDAPIVNAVEFRDTGVILNVAPRVNDNGLVLLEIEQEVSDVVATTTSGIDSPTIRQRRIATTVVVQSGQSVALGGLIREARDAGRSEIPFLGRIPVIGELFSTNRNDHERTELLVVITPRVVRDAAEARAVTEELRMRLQAIAPLALSLGAP